MPIAGGGIPGMEKGIPGGGIIPAPDTTGGSMTGMPVAGGAIPGPYIPMAGARIPGIPRGIPGGGIHGDMT